MRGTHTLSVVALLVLVILPVACGEESPTPVSFVPTLEPTVLESIAPTARVATPTVRATVDLLGKSIIAARDAALGFIRQEEPSAALPEKLLWIGENTSPEGLVGSSSYSFTAGDWVVALEYAVVPEPEYAVSVTNEATGFAWEGMVTSGGRVEPKEAPVSEKALSAHRTLLQHLRAQDGVHLPEDDTWIAANTTPKGLVDSATYQFISGDWVVTMQCLMTPGSACQVRVWNKGTGYDWEGSVAPSGEVQEAAPGNVLGWEGEVIPLCEMAQFDDFFERNDGERYGIEGIDTTVGEELAEAACGRHMIRVWGELSTSALDAGGRQIVVSRLEVVGGATPVAVEDIPEGAVVGWAGTIRAECRVSQFDDYFERDDGQRFGVEAVGEESMEKMIVACCEELPVRLWGRVYLEEEGYNGRHIIVTRIEFGY